MGILNKARSLRKNQTDVEQLLWKQLRNRNVFNYKFRRQYPIEPYIVDFICFDLKLIIELDGGQHANQADYDQQRSLFLENRGFKVIRFWNNEVTENSDGVLEVIRRLIEGIEYGLNTDHPDGCLNGDK
ncbi:MAG: endonuclease domain-containing protein [Methylococcaceae bacterium]|nr:endonuclease domain-containing protein [Methylococcaceae bacterium]